MLAIRKIINVEDKSIILNDLDLFKGKTVEVIILPIEGNQKSNPRKNELFKFRGMGHSGHRNTSKNIDEIIYGR